MKIIIHRGTHEIGGSCVEFESSQSRIVVDIGMPIVDQEGERFDEKQYQSLSGPELIQKNILPGINGFYGWDLESNPIDGLLISHSHSDHYGFYGYLRDDIKFHLGEGTRRIIDFNGYVFGSRKPIAHYNTFSSGSPFTIKQFKVTPYLMDHSAFDAYAFLIESGGKKVIYSGDFRDHGRKSKAFQWFLANAPRNVDVLMLEGTTIAQENRITRREEDVENEIRQLLKTSKRLVLIMMSAHNIDRIVSVYRAILGSDRYFAIDIYTANVLSTLGDLGKIPDPLRGFEKLKVFYPYFLAQKLGKIDDKHFLFRFKSQKITRKNIGENPDKYIMLVRPTMLADLRKMEGLGEATLIYSMWHGYLEDPKMKRFMDFIAEKNGNIISIHSGGHADLETLKEVVEVLKPKTIVPIHTFNPDLYAKHFGNVRFVSDGENIEL